MSEYIVTARKWRPMKFEDVVGQDHVTVTLRNAIATKRLAHAYLFAGPRGVGKTTTARLLAKAVNCPSPVASNPDNTCDICKEITEGRSFDVLEIDGASNRGVEEIRNLRESVRYAPAKGSYKVYIIDEVHMLTKEAFNALLKTLEEPPTHVLFIFATTEIHKLPATILSRCQRFDFRRIAIDEIIGNLKLIAREEGLTIDDESFLLIAKKGDGSLRDAQSIFDQVVSLVGKTITHEAIIQALNVVGQDVYFRVTDLVKTKDAKGGLALVDEIMMHGHDIKEFLAGLTEHLRNILIAKTTESTSLIEASDVYRKRYAEEAKAFALADLLRLQRLVNGTEAALRWSAQPRFKLEADLVQMITMHTAAEVGEVLQKVEELSKGLLTEKKKLHNDPHHSSESTMARGVAEAGPRTAPQANALFTLRPGLSANRRLSTGALGNGSNGSQTGAVHEERSRSDISKEEVRSRWLEFIAEVRRQRISLGSVMESSDVLGIHGSVLKIGCGNDFQASSIKRNKDILADVFEKIFHAKVRLEVEVHHHTVGPPQSGEQGTPRDPGATPQDEHPVIKALMNELGAEPL